MTSTLKAATLALTLATAAQAAPHLSIGLGEVEREARMASRVMKAATLDAEAAASAEASARGLLLPRLSAEASYRWVAEVPKIKLSPLAPAVNFGDHHNYSVGLLASWNLLDGGAAWKQWLAAKALSRARQAEARAQESGLRLRARLAYFQTQLAATRLRLLADATKLAQSQADDLSLRLKAGTSNRLDALAASNEELSRRVQFRLAQADLASALRDLFALTGLGAGADPALPVVDGLADSLPARVSQPSLQVALDPLDASLEALSGAAKAQFRVQEHARVRALNGLAEAAREQAGAARNGRFPRVALGARWGMEYPNGPVLESVEQKSLSASASLPIFNFGAISNHADALGAQAHAAEERAAAIETELKTQWLKMGDRLAALEEQSELNSQMAEQAASLQELVYKAYRVGGASFLEVQTSSLKALEARINLAQTKTQILIDLAELSALAE